jgi:hypothetical protein
VSVHRTAPSSFAHPPQAFHRPRARPRSSLTNRTMSTLGHLPLEVLDEILLYTDKTHPTMSAGPQRPQTASTPITLHATGSQGSLVSMDNGGRSTICCRDTERVVAGTVRRLFFAPRGLATQMVGCCLHVTMDRRQPLKFREHICLYAGSVDLYNGCGCSPRMLSQVT